MRSGIYVASCGTSRAVLGSESPDGLTVFCDEARWLLYVTEPFCIMQAVLRCAGCHQRLLVPRFTSGFSAT